MEALAALSPLLESAACTADLLTSSATTVELCALAQGLIAAAGGKVLPNSAAVLLFSLLECDGVIQQLPADEVLRAVDSLEEGRQAGRTISDSLADAIVHKLGGCRKEDMSPMLASCLLYSCGASFSYLRRAAASLLQADGSDPRHRYSVSMWLGVIFGLATYNITERMASIDGALPEEGCALERGGDRAAPATATPRGTVRDTPLADVALRAFQQVAAAVQEGRLQLQLEEDSDVGIIVAGATVLQARLEGLQVQRQELFTCLHVIQDHVADSVEAVAFDERTSAESFSIWDMLGNVLCLGRCQLKRARE